MTAAAFEINYNRPSFFGLEAEKELSAFVAAFAPRIEDPQMHGIGEGPYSRRGFLDGRNFGNVFAVSKRLEGESDQPILSLPAIELLQAWEWNYGRAARRDTFSRSAFVPRIMFLIFGDRVRRAAVWAAGESILLPKVDFVVVGWNVDGEQRLGLAPWAEAEEVARRAGFDTTTDPVDIRYLVMPAPIAAWVAGMPETKVHNVQPYRVIDEELVAAARESLQAHQRLP